MPSWGIHLGIANKLSQKIENIDKNLFMFGNVVPDINNGYVVEDISKIIPHKITHYDGEKDFKGYRKFFIKYIKNVKNPVVLGSLTHLMTDYYFNNITYSKKAIWENGKVVGIKLNTGKEIKCDKETVRKMKVNDFKIFADYIYKNHKISNIKYDEKMLSINSIVEEFDITKEDTEKTIEYMNNYIENKKSIISKCENKEYQIFTPNELEEISENCVNFILEFLEKTSKIIIGKTAGFCYGVKRAVNGAENEIKNSKEPVYCLGEIVHNKQVIEELKRQGIIFVEDINEVNGKTIIRAHGVPKEIYEKAKRKNIELKDYTCPNVLKIHKIAEEYAEKGYFIFLCGSKKHPENIGTISYCNKNLYIIEKEDDTFKALERLEKSGAKKLLVISQTTYSLEKFYIIKEIIENELPRNVELVIRNTICSSTEQRQIETKELSKKVDMMIIIGGKNSSNTKKLYEVSLENCPKAVCIESYEKLENMQDEIKNAKKIGVMAGASTPQKSIEEVIKYLI